MADRDRIENRGEELRGKAKEGVGKASGDDALQRQGRNEQRKSSLKQAWDKFKDGFKK